MTPDDPRPWMAVWPDLAALASGACAVALRSSVADGPRRPRAVIADALGTLALGWLVYRGALGMSVGPDLAFGIAGLSGACGWEWVRRRFINFVDRNSNK